MDYVYSTKEPQRYRFPTHINDLVMDRFAGFRQRSIYRRHWSGRGAAAAPA